MKNLTLYTLVLLLLITACKKESSGSKPVGMTGTQTDTTITTTYYLKGTLQGQPLIWQVTDNASGYFEGSASNLTQDQGIVTGSLTALLSSGSASLQPQLGIQFKTYQFNALVDATSYFSAFVVAGSLPYAANTNYIPNTKSVIITYTDAQGVMYSSVGSQAGNSFNVLTVTQIPAQLGTNDGLKIKVTFSANLYPASGTGSTLTLTKAEATVYLEDLLQN